MSATIARQGVVADSRFDRRAIADLRDRIRQRFCSFFRSQGYLPHAPGSIIPKTDVSVLFTGSAISTLKPYLSANSVPREGLFIVQNCLRTQNLKHFGNDAHNLSWASYFSGLGVLVRPDQLDRLAADTWRFLADELAIPVDRLRIRAASKDVDLLQYWYSAGLSSCVELDASQPSAYTHKFGMDGVSGRNCNFGVAHHMTGAIRDIGNIIVMEAEGRPVAVEIGFGVETITSRILDFPNPITASLACDFLLPFTPLVTQLADAISAAVVILDAGVLPGPTGRSYILRRYLRSTAELREKAEVDLSEVGACAEQFEREEFGSGSDIPEKITEYLSAIKLWNGHTTPRTMNEKVSAIFLAPRRGREPGPRQPIAVGKAMRGTIYESYAKLT